MSGHDCPGVWCLSLEPFRARCSCGLVVLSRHAWKDLDPEAHAQLVDPDGLQRAFMAATGLTPTVAEQPRRRWAADPPLPYQPRLL